MKRLATILILLLVIWGCNEEPEPPTLVNSWGLIALQFNDDEPITTGLENFELTLFENREFTLTDLNGVTQVGQWEQVDDMLLIKDEFGVTRQEFTIESLSRRDLVLKLEGDDVNGGTLITTYYLIVI